MKHKKLARWSILLEKMIVAHLAYYGTRRFINVFKRAYPNPGTCAVFRINSVNSLPASYWTSGHHPSLRNTRCELSLAGCLVYLLLPSDLGPGFCIRAWLARCSDCNPFVLPAGCVKASRCGTLFFVSSNLSQETELNLCLLFEKDLEEITGICEIT
jgi:hypothetical protein